MPTYTSATTEEGSSHDILDELELVKKKEALSKEEDGPSVIEDTSETKSLLSGLDWQLSLQDNEPVKEEEEIKISEAVTTQLEKDKKVNVIIKMKDKPNYDSLELNARKKQTKKERVQVVKTSLESKAEKSQKGVIASLKSLEKKGHAKFTKSLWINNSVVATIDEEALRDLENREDIESIELDEVVQLPEIKVENSAPRLPEWGLEKIYATKVWEDYGIKGKGVVVGVMDTGVDGSHEALKNNYRGRDGSHKYSWIDLSGHNYATPSDGNGHGTHVAGTAVGGGAGEPIGVAPEAEWIAAKIFTDGGSTTNSIIHEAFQWFMAPGGDPAKAPDVVNNSWGNSNGANTTYAEAVQAWIAAGIFPLFAAGNDGPGGQTIGSPGSFIDSFAVGATDSNDVIASFSSRGPVYWNDENGEKVRYIKPDISAPGHQIYSAWPTKLGRGKYHTISGTSMATPHVAGAIALLLSTRPDLTVDDVKTLLKSTTRKEAHMGTLPNDVYGEGIINIHQAVTEAAYAGEIKGNVTDTEGNPIQAKVKLIGQDREFLTQKDGYFQQKVKAGTYKVEVSAFGYDKLETEIVIVKEKVQNVSWKLKLSSIHQVNVKVLEKQSKEAVPYAYVRVVDTPLSGRTDENGEISFQRVPSGIYEVLITGEGIEGKKTPVNVTGNQTLTIEVSPADTGNSERDWKTANNNYARNAVSSNAIDYQTLQPKWHYDTGSKGEIVFSTPAATSEQLIVVTEMGWVISLNPHTGLEDWSVRIGSTNRSTPTVEDGMVFLSGGVDQTIYALDLKNGNIIWSKYLGQAAVYEAPLYRDGVLYVGSGLNTDASVFAFNAATGDLIWKKQLGGETFFGGALGDEYLYVGTYIGQTIYALNLEDGSEVWKKFVPGYGFAAKPVVDGNELFANVSNMGLGTGELFVFDALTGEVKYTVPNIGDTQATSPIIFEDIVVIGSATQPLLKAFNRKDGQLLWENRIVGTSMNNGSVSSNGLLFVTGLSGSFYIIDVYTGEVLKDFTLPSFSYSSIPVLPGMVLVPYRKGIQAYASQGAITGHITDANGKAIAGKLQVLETLETAIADENGRYSLEHVPGEYTIKASYYGKKQVIQKVKLVSGYPLERNFKLEDASQGTLELKVTDKRTKEPLSDVEIVLEDTPIIGNTNGEGDYQKEVYEGEYYLTLSLTGYAKIKQIVTIKPGKENNLEIELQPFDIAVLNDWNGEVTTVLNRNGFHAEERDWDILENIDKYQIIYLNGAYTSGGTPPDEETFNRLLSLAKEHDVDLVFVDAWGIKYGSIEQLNNYLKDPKEFNTHYSMSTGIVQLKVDKKHPILEGYEVGDKLTLFSRTSDFAWFNQYSGKHLATVGNTNLGDKGTGVAYKPVSENSAHVVLANHAATPWISPLQGWSKDMANILYNTMDYLLEAKYGVFKGKLVDSEGEPIQGELEILETNTLAKTDSETGELELFHEEGEYLVEIRSLGYKTVNLPVTFENGVPIMKTVVMESTEEGTITGIIVDAGNNPVNGAKVTLLLDDEVIEEKVVSENGRYEFTNLVEGNYKVRVNADGFLVEVKDIRLRDEPLSIDFTLTAIPRVAVLNDSSTATGFGSVLREKGIPVTNLTIANVVEEIGKYDVLFVNQTSTSSFKKENLDALLAAADKAGTSLIFGESTFTDSPISQLQALRKDPGIRERANVTNMEAGYVVEEKHPIFGDAKVGDYLPILIGSKSTIGYFNEYSGTGIAKIKHEGRDPYGLGIAYKPRTSESVELLMGGHGFSISHTAEHYTQAGKELLVRAVLWAATANFATVSGTVKDVEGNPVNASIQVVGERHITTTDLENGYFEMALLDGEYQLEVSAYGYQSKTVSAVVGANGVPLEITLETDESIGSITGSVENEKDSVIVEGAEVTIPAIGYSTLTDTQGKFELSILMPGTHRLVVKAEGFVQKEIDVVVESRSLTELKITMKPTPTVGIIVDNTANEYSLASYLQSRGYNTTNIFYTDLDKLDDVDIVIANSDYDNTKIPSKDVLTAFLKRLDEKEKPIIWTGHVSGRGGIRFLKLHENNPSIEGSKIGADIRGKITEAHPIVKGIPQDELFNMNVRFNEYYYFGGYNGTTVAELESQTGKVGDFVAYNGRTINSVEVLLANLTFSHNFNHGPAGFMDPYRERILNNAITWALDNKEPLVGEIHGQVTNNLGNQVEASITVAETGKKVTADSSGRFFLGLSEGTYTLNLQAFGHEDKEFNVEVVKGQATNVKINMQAESSGVINGVVVDELSENPISNATVTVLGTPLSTKTNESGQFTITVPEGSYDVRVSAPGFTPMVQPVEILSGQNVEVTYHMATSQKVAFVGLIASAERLVPYLREEGYDVDVIDQNNYEALQANLDEYAVIILNSRSSRMSDEALRLFVEKADEQEVSIIFTSQYNGGGIRDLSESHGDPEAVRYSTVPQYVNVKVLADHPLFTGINATEFRLLDKGRDTLLQQYAIYENYSGTTVGKMSHFERGELGDGIGFKYSSANSVHILLSSLQVGSYSSVYENWTAEAKQLFTNALDWAISASTGEVFGTVLDTEGNPIGNALVEIDALGLATTTNAKGEYRLSVGTGTYNITANARGYGESSKSVVIAEQGEAVEVDFELTAIEGTLLEGTVLENGSQQPIEGATVILKEAGKSSSLEETLTDAEGVFSFNKMIPGEYEITTLKNGYLTSVQRVTVEEEDIDLTILLNAVQIGVIGDWNNKLTDFLNEREQFADAVDWDVVEHITDYKLIIVNTSKGTKEQLEELIQVTDEQQISLVFLESWANEGSFSLLRDTLGYPEIAQQGYNSGAVTMKAKADHPIFTGLPEMFTIHSEKSPYATFINYPGEEVGTIEVDGADKGTAVAYSFRSENSVHLLLSSFSVTNIIGPDYGWTTEGKQLFLNAIEWAKVAEQTIVLPQTPVWSHEELHVKGSPVTVRGTSEVGTTVHIYERSGNKQNLLGSVQTSSDGTFSTELHLSNGNHFLLAEAENSKGKSNDMALMKLVVSGKQNPKPFPNPGPEPELPLPKTPTWEKDNMVVKESLVTLKGFAEAGTTVHIYDSKGNQKNLLGSVKTRSDGTFSIELQLKNGGHFLFAEAENTTGKSVDMAMMRIVVSGKSKPIPNVDPEIEAEEPVSPL